jgi:O-Antigen ligase
VAIVLRYREHWLYYVLIPLVPFSQSIPVATLGRRSVNLGLDTVLIAILMVWHRASRPFSQDEPQNREKASQVLVVWLIWNVLTVVFSAAYLKRDQFAECLVVLCRWGQYVPLFVVLAAGKLSYEQCKKTIVLLTMTAVAASALGWFQLSQGLYSGVFKGAPSFTVPLMREKDAADYVDDLGMYTGSANYNVVGAYMLLALAMFLPFVLRAHTPVRRIGGYLLVVFFASGVVITFSRISAVALVVLFLYCVQAHSRVAFRRTLVATSLVLVTAFALLQQFTLIADLTETTVRVWEVVPLVLHGDNYLSGTSDASSTVFGAALRVVGIRNSLEMFATHPVTGYGFNAFQFFGSANTPDNYFLQILAETGLPGFGLLIMFLYTLVISTKPQGETSRDNFLSTYRIGFRGALIAMILVNLTGGIFYIQKAWGPFLIVAGIWLCISRRRLGDGISGG